MAFTDIHAPSSSDDVKAGSGPRDDAVGYLLAFLLLLISPPLLLIFGVPALLIPCVGAILVRVLFPRVSMFLLIVSCIFQNLFIAFWVTNSNTVQQVSGARALSFVILLAAFACAVVLPSRLSKQELSRTSKLRWLCYVTIVAVLAQAAVGAMTAGPMGAATYARNMMMAAMATILGLECRDSRAVFRMMTIAFIAALLFGYAEEIFREQFYVATGLDQFLLRTSERASEIQFRYFLGFTQWLKAQQTVLFNDPNLAESGMVAVRLMGPTAHPISFGYALVITSLPLLARWPLLVFLAQLPVQYSINSKGAFFLLVACTAARLCAPILNRMSPTRTGVMITLAWTAFIGAAIYLGLQHGDFHVLGFFGGVHAFLAAPWGHGVGTAGNLTEAGINGQINWSAVQFAGASDRGIESAVGVLLDQLGVLSFIYFLLWAWIITALLKFRNNMTLVFATAAIGLVANGVLQEEALFSPSSAALLCFMIGAVLARPAERTPA